MNLNSKTAKIIYTILIVITVFFIGRQFGGAEKPIVEQVHTESETAAPTIWTCSMHPQVKLPEPGQCPICFMDLIPLVQHEDSDNPLELKLSPAAAELAEIEVSPVVRKEVETVISLSGKVEYDETLISRIAAWIPGRLERLFVDYTGIHVEKGDHLVELYSPELITAQEELIQAYHQYQNNSDDARLRHETIEKTLNAARDKFRLLGLTDKQIFEIENRDTPTDHVTIYSPASGYVIHKNAVEGMYVSTGTPIYTIADLSRVWVVLDAYESQIPMLNFGQEVTFEPEALPGKLFSGRIAYIDPVINEKTRTVNVRLNISNDDGFLKPGMFVRANVESVLDADGRAINHEMAGKWVCPMHPEIIQDHMGTCDVCGMDLVQAEDLGIINTPSTDELPLVVPASAVLKTGKRAVVYVRKSATDGPVFEGREVVLSSRADDYYIIKSGLTEGEEVVTKGSFKIDSAMQISAKSSMMNPEGGATPTSHHHESGTMNMKHGTTANALNISSDLAESVMTAYLNMQSALSEDDFDAAYSAMMEIHRQTMGVKGAESIMQPTMNPVSDLSTLRKSFKKISDIMRSAAEQGLISTPVNEAYCPMAFDFQGAYWIQTGKTINNPYFGSKMRRCGEIRRQWNHNETNK